MDSLASKLEKRRSGKAGERLAVVAAYEDSSTDARVSEFCAALGKKLGPRCEVARQMWLLSELRQADLRKIAAEEAARADVVVVSLHQNEHVPPEIRGWVEAWLKARNRQPLLLSALLDAGGISDAARAYLQDAARRGNLEFTSETEENPGDL